MPTKSAQPLIQENNSLPNSCAFSHRQLASYEFSKRAFDLVLAIAGVIVCAPLMLAIAALIKADSPGPVFYRGQRVGRHGVSFRIWKFRTMVTDAELNGVTCTSNDDRRITRAGKVLRNTKLDELPQLFNVIFGDMSLVGPRPEVKKFTDLFTPEERHILDAKPGITDWATLWDSDEGTRLAGAVDPDHEYMKMIRPTKIALQLDYVRSRSFWTDLAILFRTVGLVLRKIFLDRT